MKRQFVSLIVTCCVAASSVAEQPKDSSNSVPADEKQHVLDFNKKWAAAETRHDADALRRILDEKFVASFDTEPPYDREAFIKFIAGANMSSQTLTDATVIIDHDTAVVVGTDTVRGTENGTAYTAVYRYTSTYVHRHGRWVALAEHVVSVPQAK